jgi:hypothetical protein
MCLLFFLSALVAVGMLGLSAYFLMQLEWSQPARLAVALLGAMMAAVIGIVLASVFIGVKHV